MARKRKASIIFSSLREYKAADPSAFALLFHSQNKRNLKADILFKIRQGNIPWMIIPESVIDLTGTIQKRPALAVRAALKNIVTQRYSFAKKGFPLTTNLTSSLMASLDKYFLDLAQYSTSMAFRWFQENAIVGFKVRKVLMRYALQLKRTNQFQLKALTTKLEPFSKKEIIRDYSVGRSILWANYLCGTRSTKLDHQQFLQIYKFINHSHSMEEFLRHLKGL